MYSSICFTFIIVLFLSINCVKIHSEPIQFDYDQKWETGYHPFPEMSRFLNSHSRIHRPSAHSSYSLLGYLCSIANDRNKIKEILNTFGKKYRSLILTIIAQDCAKYKQRHKRMTINNIYQQKNFPRIFLRNLIDYHNHQN